MDVESYIGRMRLKAPVTLIIADIAKPASAGGGTVNHRLDIPAGYHWDGASIPWMLWYLIGSPFEPRFLEASLAHDWYCELAHDYQDYQLRVIGDSVFLALLQRAGVPYWKRSVMYCGVRLNSWLRYSWRWK